MKRKTNIKVDEGSYQELKPISDTSSQSSSEIKDINLEEGSNYHRPSYKRSTTSLSSTALSSMFYSQCALSGISSEDAENAISESRQWYHNWWRQQRFYNSDSDSDENDPSLPFPKKSRRKCTSNSDVPTEEESSVSTVEESSHLIPDDDVETLKRQVLHSLKASGGDVTNSEFLKYLSMLSELYTTVTAEEEKKDEEALCASSTSGVWVTLNKPHFQECLGRDSDTGEYMYTLGRMSFDMFRKDLKCCVKGIYNMIEDAQDDLTNENFLLPNGLTTEDCIDQGIMTYK